MSAQAQTLVAGTTAGQFSVSENGAATYRIPIQVSPGLAGMEPKLEMVYSSQGGNGAMGLGWGLSGLSAINRCPRTMASDGVRGGVNLDANDRYCLDGQRLLMTTGTVYGAASTEYRTEIESFSKITFDGTAFTVKTKAGLTVEYGVTGDARIEAQGKTAVRTWAANKITDKVGNYLTISYDEDLTTGAYYVSRIDYAGPAGQTANRSVRFENLTGRLDAVPMYQNGSLIKTAKRLNTVKTYIGENLVKEYRLTYAPQTTAFDRSRLTTFTECDGLNNCLKPIQFTWTPSPNGLLTLKSNFNITDTNLAHSNKTAGSWLGDFNGDGKTDILRWSNTVGSNELYLSNGDGTFTAASGFTIKATGLGINTNTLGVLPGDFNGDGKTDLLRWSDTVASNVLYTSNELINPDTLEKILSDREVSFGYTPLTSSAIYTKDSSAVYPLLDLQPPMYVTSVVRTSNAIGTGLNTSNYTYGGLKAEAGTGRGALGFRWIKNKEQSTNIESYSEYRQDWPFVGMLTKNETRLANAGNAGVLKRTTQVPACKSPQTGEFCSIAVGNRYFPYAASSLEQSWDLNATAYPSLLTNTAYNLNSPDTELRGDPTQIYVNAIQDGFISTRKTVNEYLAADTTNWKLGRLSKATVTSNEPVALPAASLGEVAVLSMTVSPLSTSVERAGSGNATTYASAIVSGGVGPYTYSWARVVGTKTVITNGNTPAPTFTAAVVWQDNFTETMRVTVTDSIGGSIYQDVSVRYWAGFPFNPVISANKSNYNLRAEAIAVGWNQLAPLQATVTVNAGVIVSASSVANYAFDTGVGFPAGSTLALINNGSIVGMGGAGGAGGNGNFLPPVAGQIGGPGLRSQFTIVITNLGTIGGGGTGGSGGPGFEVETSGGCCAIYGGYGGGGGRSGATNSAGGSYAGNPGTASGGGAGKTLSFEFGPSSQSGSGSNYGGGPAVVGNSNIVWLVTGSRLGALN